MHLISVSYLDFNMSKPIYFWLVADIHICSEEANSKHALTNVALKLDVSQQLSRLEPLPCAAFRICGQLYLILKEIRIRI